jgi:superfamily II DNA or RNA helicase
MSPAPFRLGLTATYPEAHEQSDGRWRIDDLIGPIVYEKRIDDLVGERLAEYRTVRVRVNLTAEERQRYDQDWAIYSGYFRRHELQKAYGPGWLGELQRRSAYDRDARRALLARQRLQQLLAGAEGKLQTLDNLLREHSQEQVLIFTESNAVVYAISRRFLIPALTHETRAAERKHLLDAFRAGDYRALVTSRVLNEGIDVPEAKVAIVLGGTASAREYIQRLGRVLRKIGNQEAVLYELIVRKTIDEGKAARRRPREVAHADR